MLFVMCVCGHIKRNKSGSLIEITSRYVEMFRSLKKLPKTFLREKKHTHRHKHNRDKDMNGKVECILNV